MNESPPKPGRAAEERKKTYTQHFLDSDKESKIKGCQRKAPRCDGFYMKFMRNQRNRSSALPVPPCCENLFKQASFFREYENHHHTFVLLARLNPFHVVTLCLPALFYYEKLHKFSKRYKFDSVAYYLCICFMPNVNQFVFSVIIWNTKDCLVDKTSQSWLAWIRTKCLVDKFPPLRTDFVYIMLKNISRNPQTKEVFGWESKQYVIMYSSRKIM